MNLKLILPIKKVMLADKTYSIPKLGLKHYGLVKDVQDPIKALRVIMDSIHPGLDAAKSDFLTLHLMEFNNKLLSERTIDGFTYRLADVYICQRLSFQFQGNEFNFRSHRQYEELGPVDNVLKTLFIGEPPEFLDMPAFVAKWADDILNTVAIPGPNGPVKGMLKILEILDGNEQ